LGIGSFDAMTENVIDRIIRHEGFRSHVYLDSKGFLSLGYGTTVGKVSASVEKLIRDFPSQLQARGVGTNKALARLAVQDRVGAVRSELEDERSVFVSLSHVRCDVLVEMAYQLGVNGCLNFKLMWIALGNDDYEAASDEMLDSVWAREPPPRGTPERAEELAGIMRAGVG